MPALASYAEFALQADGKPMSTTMAFIADALRWRDTALGPRLVPIVADEARTFGMANLFRQVGIYSSAGQTYAPGGHRLGAQLSGGPWTGPILEEGISEAGAITELDGGDTSYSDATGLAMLPFYPTRCLALPARGRYITDPPPTSDARGFLLATEAAPRWAARACSTRTAASHLVAATIPNCKAYDPAYAGEMAVIIDAGMREMMTEQRDVFYYVTLMNENYAQPTCRRRGTKVCCAAAMFSGATSACGRAWSPISSNHHPAGLRAPS